MGDRKMINKKVQIQSYNKCNKWDEENQLQQQQQQIQKHNMLRLFHVAATIGLFFVSLTPPHTIYIYILYVSSDRYTSIRH